MLNILKQFSAQLISPDLFIRKRYATFQELLERTENATACLRRSKTFTTTPNRSISTGYVLFTPIIPPALRGWTPASTGFLRDSIKILSITTKNRFLRPFRSRPTKCNTAPPYILPIGAPYADDLQTGGKGLHLSQLSHLLKLPVPAGFIISTAAWNSFLTINELRPKINRLLAQTEINSLVSLQEVSETLTGYINEAPDITRILNEKSMVQSALCGKISRPNLCGSFQCRWRGFFS